MEMSVIMVSAAALCVGGALGWAVGSRKKGGFADSMNGFLQSSLSGRPDISARFESRLATGALERSTQGYLNSFMESIRTVLGHVSTLGYKLVDISDSMKKHSNSMLNMAEKTSSHADQVATSMSEMTMTINDIAQHVESSAQTSKTLRDEAMKAQTDIGENLRGIQALSMHVTTWSDTNRELAQSAVRIYGIVGVINEIADQTNLLALNAAIEAARAGEQGRGFAVVAEEVRKLADKTTKSVKEVSQMIEDMKRKAESSIVTMETTLGSVTDIIHRAEGADTFLRHVSVQTERIAEMTEGIATSIQEQSSVSDDVLKNMQQVSNHASKTSHLARELSGMGDAISTQAVGLYNEMCNLKTTSQDRAMDERLASWSTELQARLEESIKAGRITQDALFDERYAETEKGKYANRSRDYFDREVLPELKKWVSSAKGLIYVVAMDRNGFMPTHLQPARAGVMMKDPVSQNGCRAQKLMGQAFRRPMEAGGELVVDVATPIVVAGRHWGCLRVGYLPER